jgi:nicotinate phosphoribosyltransferase
MKPPAQTSPLFTDLYEITMAAGYDANSLACEATFSVFVRHHPNRRFYIAAGLNDAMAAIAAFRFSEEDLYFLAKTERFSTAFLEKLEALRFTGSMAAMPEGTVFFPNEPIMEITAPIMQVQLLETRILNAIGLPTLIATKAARCVRAAAGRPVIDFSLRRTQGPDAGMTVARSAYLAGVSATSNVLAGQKYGIPLSGTMAHSFVMAFPDELAAFLAYARTFPDSTVLLIDTYDVDAGTRNAVKTAEWLKSRGKALIGVRLDSGDLVAQSIRVRRQLDAAGFPRVKIFASSSLDEFSIEDIIARGACIDAFGVGTRMGVSADRPYLDIVYKLVAVGGRNVAKRSAGKATVAGMKQVFRKVGPDGMMAEDIIGERNESLDGVPLLMPVMAKGVPTVVAESLEAIRTRVADGLSAMPAPYLALKNAPRFPVSFSTRLKTKQP